MSPASFGDFVELDRNTVQTAPAAKKPAELLFHVAAGAGDPGGAVDRTAQTGESYRYTAQRIRTVVLGPRSVEVRSPLSASVTVAMLDVFPPNAPAGLVTSPGFVDDGSAAHAQKPTIDLSWEPAMEPHTAGYRVYRRNAAGGIWARLNSALATAPEYRDLTVAAGAQLYLSGDGGG